ncbi:hypothetical protein EIN_480630 [Entamoeba invadens IP1]|uniref:Major facilitator superfamily (MFS) profile domain-containing protein n=1 Tax=Entamoeba invadens IP1 TaxID=370355 RepID=L7FMF5_ENTIV|nr:hypothetical protein EIN_480630 [Entamoeba invadens IP1]ELP91154.1 hypothetical protein EIN_480630 [Entamoeba invadens IP1]|eukprot:XP_004257925.1 hypothetical protein EIN_480630 [Entamoeba invadens IP1]
MPLYCITSMFFDFSVYFYWLVAPVLVKELRAPAVASGAKDDTPLIIGAADALTFCLAGLLAPVMGILTDKWRGEILCEIGCIFQAISCILTALFYVNNTSIWPLFLFLVIQGVGLSMFWSPDETLIGAESYIGEENKNISYFATLSAFGKAVGFLFAGSATVLMGNTYSFYFGALLPLIIFVVFPRIPGYKNDQTNPSKVFQNNAVKRVHPKIFYYTSLIVHLFNYGIIAIVQNQYVDYATDKNIILKGVSSTPSLFVGIFLFSENVVQTITFVVLGKWVGWQYHQRYNLIAFVAMFVVSCGLFIFTNGWMVMIFSVPMGMVAGYELQANLYYSITVSEAHGKYLGISEFIGEMTYSLSPLLVGIFCSALSRVWMHIINMSMCVIGFTIVGVATLLYQKTHLFDKKITQENTPIELEDLSRTSSMEKTRDSMDSARALTSMDGNDNYRNAILKAITEAKEESPEINKATPPMNKTEEIVNAQQKSEIKK